MLEAMSAGCAVIASNTLPVNELIKHEQNGLVVNFFSPEEIAQAVEGVLDNPRKYQKMRENARASILDNYTIQQGIKKYIALLIHH